MTTTTNDRDFAAFLAKLATPAAVEYETRNDPDMAALADTIEKIATAFDEHKARVERMETKLARPGGAGTAQTDAADDVTIDIVGGRKGRLLGKTARLTRGEQQMREAGAELADFVAGQVLGRKAVSRGPSLVQTDLAGVIIDDVRARTTVIEAGSRTMIIDGPAVATRITGDATVHQHTEGANDVTVSDVTTDGVTLDPKALVARVPLTAELVEDSANLDLVLRTSLAAAFALKLDALCLATILADVNVPKSATGQDPAIWAKCLEAVTAALAAKQALPTAMITNATDFIARASQLASTAGSWLGKPPVLAGMTELPTTALAAGTALYGGFNDAFMVVTRQELRLEVIRFYDPGRYSHELVAHMRADGVLVQPKRLFKQLKTVV